MAAFDAMKFVFQNFESKQTRRVSAQISISISQQIAYIIHGSH